MNKRIFLEGRPEAIRTVADAARTVHDAAAPEMRGRVNAFRRA